MKQFSAWPLRLFRLFVITYYGLWIIYLLLQFWLLLAFQWIAQTPRQYCVPLRLSNPFLSFSTQAGQCACPKLLWALWVSPCLVCIISSVNDTKRLFGKQIQKFTTLPERLVKVFDFKCTVFQMSTHIKEKTQLFSTIQKFNGSLCSCSTWRTSSSESVVYVFKERCYASSCVCGQTTQLETGCWCWYKNWLAPYATVTHSTHKPGAVEF